MSSRRRHRTVGYLCTLNMQLLKLKLNLLHYCLSIICNIYMINNINTLHWDIYLYLYIYILCIYFYATNHQPTVNQPVDLVGQDVLLAEHADAGPKARDRCNSLRCLATQHGESIPSGVVMVVIMVYRGIGWWLVEVMNDWLMVANG